MATNLFCVVKMIASIVVIICGSLMQAVALGTTIDSATANLHIQNAVTTGDAPNGVYLLPIPPNVSGALRIDGGSKDDITRATLAQWSGMRTTQGYFHECPPFCKRQNIDNVAVPMELLAHTNAEGSSTLSSSEATQIISSLNSETTEQLTVAAEAIDWLQKLGAASMEVARGRDRNNNCELIIGGYDKNGKIVGNGRFYVLPVDCPGDHNELR